MQLHTRCLFGDTGQGGMWNVVRVPTQYHHLGREEILYVGVHLWLRLNYDRILNTSSDEHSRIQGMMDSTDIMTRLDLVYVTGINATIVGEYTLNIDLYSAWCHRRSALTESISDDHTPCVFACTSAVCVWRRSAPSIVRVISVVFWGLKLHFCPRMWIVRWCT